MWIGPSDGTGLRRVYSGGEPLASAHWSPTADVIYAFRARNAASDLLAFDVPASGTAVPRVLASGLPSSSAADLSADGRWLLATRGEGHTNVWTVDLSGPEPKAASVTSGTGTFSAPALSPDGQWIAAVYQLGPTYTIVKIPVAGGEPVPLMSGANRLSSPAWSPDGASIAFATIRDGAPELWLMNPDGTKSQRIPATAMSSNLRVVWTPDGRIAWQQFTGRGAPAQFYNYAVRDLSTAKETLLASDSPGGWLNDPVFSPAGDRVVYRWNRMPGSPIGIWISSWPDGRERVLAPGRMRPVGWSRDGRSIYVVGPDNPADLLSMNAETGESKLLMKLPVGTIADGAASRDGRTSCLNAGVAWGRVARGSGTERPTLNAGIHSHP